MQSRRQGKVQKKTVISVKRSNFILKNVSFPPSLKDLFLNTYFFHTFHPISGSSTECALNCFLVTSFFNHFSRRGNSFPMDTSFPLGGACDAPTACLCNKLKLSLQSKTASMYLQELFNTQSDLKFDSTFDLKY